MATIYNETFKIAAPAPIDTRYLSRRTLFGSPMPYSGVTDANTVIISSERYTGLTVNIKGIEYWYANGVTDSDLIPKFTASVGDYITGATNIGYFSGYTGIQTLPIDYLYSSDFDGDYTSLYNYYYRGTDGVIHVGAPSDGIQKRGYVKLAYPTKSWIWNEDTTDGLVGWAMVDGNIENQIGTFQYITTYYDGVTTFPYTGSSWNTGFPYNNSSSVVINTVRGSLTTGNTLTIGGPVYAKKVDRVLEFRTLQTLTPQLIKITNNEAFVYFSGTTGNQIIYAGNGLTKTGQTVVLGGHLTGSSVITDIRAGSNATGIQYGGDYCANFVDRSLVDKGYVDRKATASGERINKTICKPSHGFALNTVIGWSGGTYNRPIANGTYDGEVIGIVTKYINTDCFDLTQAGYYSGFTGLTINTTYFLSENTPGLLTPIEPSTVSYISKAVLIATASNSGWVLPYAGYIIASGITEGGPLIKSVCLPLSPYAMVNTDYFVGMSGGGVAMLPTTPKLGMEVVVGDISGTAFSSPITVFGTIIGPQSSASVNTDNGSLRFIWNGSTWSVIGFSPAAY